MTNEDPIEYDGEQLAAILGSSQQWHETEIDVFTMHELLGRNKEPERMYRVEISNATSDHLYEEEVNYA